MRKHGAVLVDTREYLYNATPPTFGRYLFIFWLAKNECEDRRQKKASFEDEAFTR